MAVIKNYGLRWVRDRVEWGGRGVKGALLGVPRSAKSSNPVDFRDQIGVYVLYEPGFAPIYVGQAGFGQGTLFTRPQGTYARPPEGSLEPFLLVWLQGLFPNHLAATAIAGATSPGLASRG